MNIKFQLLEPRFIQLSRTNKPCETWSWHEVESLNDADGVMFLDPVEFEKQGIAGTSSVICFFVGRNIPDGMRPGPGRWKASGNLESLTLSPSVDLGSGRWHGHITNGVVT